MAYMVGVQMPHADHGQHRPKAPLYSEHKVASHLAPLGRRRDTLNSFRVFKSLSFLIWDLG